MDVITVLNHSRRDADTEKATSEVPENGTSHLRPEQPNIVRENGTEQLPKPRPIMSETLHSFLGWRTNEFHLFRLYARQGRLKTVKRSKSSIALGDEPGWCRCKLLRKQSTPTPTRLVLPTPARLRRPGTQQGELSLRPMARFAY
jgi:hypothetical protein